MAAVTHLLFDFGGTLDGATHWLDRFLSQYRAAGFEIRREELDPAFDFATRTGYGATRIVTRFGLVDLVRFLVGHQFEYLRRSGPESIRASLERAGAPGRHRAVETVTTSFVRETKSGMEQSRTVLAALKPRYKMGVVSNFYGNLDRILSEARLDRFFSAVIDSSRAGVFKPEPAIFKAALDKLRIGAESAAMIGDSLGKDIAPAKGLGMRTVWMCTDARRKGSPGDTEADFVIDTLSAVAGLEW
ncbi:MAG TPA: HAD family hydrolase [Candidatus Binataceae bacterium]|nr:HAD family hydrolase [Candidatus Binataceae bacterium]